MSQNQNSLKNHVKSPDVALFPSEDERIKARNSGVPVNIIIASSVYLLLKRYGRNLQEGISGFYLEFENRIPLYQIIYLLKKSKTPWGILTNGRYWILVKKPVHFEKKLIEIDLEAPLALWRRKIFPSFFQRILFNRTKQYFTNDFRAW